MMEFADDMTLEQARDELRKLADEGHKCPCCTQFTKVYRRKIHASMAHALILMYRLDQTLPDDNKWIAIADILEHRQVADAAKLKYWGLIEEEDAVREDGSGRTGHWRLTDLGRRFVRGNALVNKYVRIFNGRKLHDRTQEEMGGPVTIHDCLGKRFNYRDLMVGV
jgi:hypothetical protein